MLFRLLGCGFAVLLTIALGQAYVESQAEKDFHLSLQDIPVQPPPGKPQPSQRSIDLAMAIYSIQTPHNAVWPRYDADLVERGLTVKQSFSDNVEVTIGPAAFTSWAVLASTLGHELEVHAEQNFLMIFAMDLLGLGGTDWAERTAYEYEIQCAHDHGLSASEQDMIRETVDHYYPLASETSVRGDFGRWMARRFLSP